MKLLAPAKLNLYLEVLDNFKEGFHDIVTVFQTVDLCDDVSLARTGGKDIRVICFYPARKEPARELGGKNNIASRAASLFLKRSGHKDGLEIRIIKRIPLASGLGGGSSDAACVLLGLNRLLKCGYRTEELLPLASEIGSDVPFFLYGHTALGEGRGDNITPLCGIRRSWVVLVKPPFGIRARWAYGMVDRLRLELTKRVNVNRIKKLLRTDVAGLAYNRLEEAVLPSYPVIAEIKRFLAENGADFSLMSGSGSVVFGFVRDCEKGKEIERKVKKKFKCSAWLVRTC